MLLLSALVLWAANESDPGAQGVSDAEAPIAAEPARLTALEYQQHLLRAVAPLYKQALQQGPSVSEEEIQRRLAHYKRAFPNQRINRKQLADELLIDKYLRAQYRYAVSQQELDERFRFLQANTDTLALDRKSLQPLLESHALLAHPEVVAYCAELSGAAIAAAMQKKAAENKPWTGEQINIPGDGSACVASLANERACLVTAAQLNAMLAIAKPSHTVPLDSARLATLRLMLENLFYTAKAEEEGFGTGTEVDERIEEMIAMEQLTSRLRQIGPPVTNPDILHFIYDKYYHQFFSRRTTTYASLWGSSDSAAIEVLYAKAVSPSPSDSQAESTSAAAQYLWAHSRGPLCADSLPDELARICDTLSPGEFSRPYHSPYGSFFFHKDSVALRRGISVQDAKLKLIYLATRERWLNPDSVYRAQAHRQYVTNPTRYRTPDTLFIRCWLTNGQGPGNGTTPDTATSSPRVLRSTQLPTPIRISLEQALQPDSTGRYRAHFVTTLGTFFCKVDSIHPGGKPLGFPQVEQALIQQLRQGEFSETNFEPGAIDTVQQLVYRQHARSQLYQTALRERIQLRTQSGQQQNTPEPSDAPSAEDIAVGQLFDAFNLWYATLSIDECVLYRKKSIPTQPHSTKAGN